MDNFKFCGEGCEKNLTEDDINDVARKLEYNIICSAKAISTYRFLVTQKVG